MPGSRPLMSFWLIQPGAGEGVFIVRFIQMSDDFHDCHLAQFDMQKIQKAPALNGRKSGVRTLQKRNPWSELYTTDLKLGQSVI